MISSSDQVCGPAATRARRADAATTTRRRPIPPEAARADVLKNGEGHDQGAVGERRTELCEEFEREVVGRVPKDVPKVTWTVEDVVPVVGGPPVVGGAWPAGRQRGAPDQGGDGAHRRHAGQGREAGAGDDVVPRRPAAGPGSLASTSSAGRRPGPRGPPGTERLIKAGWGYAFSPVQHPGRQRRRPDQGIIGLANKGQPRKPDDWGSLRAWAWGAARALDYLETDKTSTPSESASTASRATARPRWSRWPSTRASRSSSSDRPARAAPSSSAATSARPSRTWPRAASTTGWPATS